MLAISFPGDISCVRVLPFSLLRSFLSPSLVPVCRCFCEKQGVRCPIKQQCFSVHLTWEIRRMSSTVWSAFQAANYGRLLGLQMKANVNKPFFERSIYLVLTTSSSLDATCTVSGNMWTIPSFLHMLLSLFGVFRGDDLATACRTQLIVLPVPVHGPRQRMFLLSGGALSVSAKGSLTTLVSGGAVYHRLLGLRRLTSCSTSSPHKTCTLSLLLSLPPYGTARSTIWSPSCIVALVISSPRSFSTDNTGRTIACTGGGKLSRHTSSLRTTCAVSLI